MIISNSNNGSLKTVAEEAIMANVTTSTAVTTSAAVTTS
jgi:hypothetical protein